MHAIALTREESRLFEEALDAAVRLYQHRAKVATQAADMVTASALKATFVALRTTAGDLRGTRIGSQQRGPLALSWRWADEGDENSMETVITIHRGDPDTTGYAMLAAILSANRQGEAPHEIIALLERLTS